MKKFTKTLLLATAFVVIGAGCASNRPVPCDAYAYSINGEAIPCGPKKPINW